MTILRNARVVDGTGAPAFDGDVALSGDRITGVGMVEGRAGATEIDVTGLVVAPGFIDLHTHYDAQIVWDPDLTPSAWHGVTTVLMGNCGFGVAPCGPDDRRAIVGTLENVEGMSIEALEAGIDWSFRTFPEYLDAIKAQGTRLNVAAMLGHTPLRLAVMGLEGSLGEPTDAQRRELMAILDEALAAGAWGFASSKSENHQGYKGGPVPSRGASYDEIELLASRVGDGGGRMVQATTGPGLFVDQFSRLARTADVPVTWTALLTGVGRRGTALRLLDRTSELGGEVWPQISCRPLVMQFHLADPAPFGKLPSFQDVLATDRRERAGVYADPAWRERARREVDENWKHEWANVTVAETSGHGALADGTPLDELAHRRGIHPLDLVLDLSLDEDLGTRFRIVLANHDEEELAELLADERCVLGLSDAGAHASQLCDACFSTHLLGYWVRERQVLSLEKAVWRLTGQLASTFGFVDRGVVRTGALADIVVFDPDEVGPGDTYRVEDLPSGADRLLAMGCGVEHLWVNGVAVRRHGEDVPGARPGLVLRP